MGDSTSIIFYFVTYSVLFSSGYIITPGCCLFWGSLSNSFNLKSVFMTWRRIHPSLVVGGGWGGTNGITKQNKTKTSTETWTIYMTTVTKYSYFLSSYLSMFSDVSIFIYVPLTHSYKWIVLRWCKSFTILDSCMKLFNFSGERSKLKVTVTKCLNFIPPFTHLMRWIGDSSKGQGSLWRSKHFSSHNKWIHTFLITTCYTNHADWIDLLCCVVEDVYKESMIHS